jgi:hypothetical protein
LNNWDKGNTVVSLCGLSVAFHFSMKNESGESHFEEPDCEANDFGDFYAKLDGYMVDISALDWRKPSLWKKEESDPFYYCPLIPNKAWSPSDCEECDYYDDWTGECIIERDHIQ